MQNGFSMVWRLPSKIITSFSQRGFAKDVSVLMSGTAISQGITLATAPILSRLYDPSAFGVFALFTSILSILSVVATWRYELAIVLPHDDEDAANILVLSCSVVVLMSAATAALIAIGDDWIAARLGSPALKPMLWWLPVSILMIGFYHALNYWSTRRKHFRRLSISQVFRSVASHGTQASAGLAHIGTAGLIGGQIAGQTMATAVLGYQVWSNDKEVVRRAVSYPKMKRVAVNYKDFPKYNSWQALISSISHGVPPFLLAYFFSDYTVGLYAISLRFLQMPLSLLGQSVRQVFFPKASEAHRSNKAYPLLVKATMALLTIGIVPTLIVVLFGPSIFSVVLGKKWYAAGVYAQFMMPWLLVGLINSPSVMMIPILNRQNVHMVYEFVLLLLRIAAIAYGAYLGSDVVSIASSSIIGFIFNLALIFYVINLTRVRAQSIEQENT